MIGVGLGLINGFFIARFKLPTLIVTLGHAEHVQGFLLFAIGNQIIRDVPPSLPDLPARRWCGYPWTRHGQPAPGFFITIGAILVVYVLLNYTMLGRSIYALGGS